MATAKELHELTVEDLNRARGRAARDAVPGPAEAADRRARQPVEAHRRTAATSRGSSPSSRQKQQRPPRRRPEARKRDEHGRDHGPERRRPRARSRPRPSQDPHRHRHLEQDAEDGGRDGRAPRARTRKYGKILTHAREVQGARRGPRLPEEVDDQRGRQGPHRRDPARCRRTSAGAWSRCSSEQADARVQGRRSTMIQMTTVLDVADNSGAKKVFCIKVLGGSQAQVRLDRRRHRRLDQGGDARTPR